MKIVQMMPMDSMKQHVLTILMKQMTGRCYDRYSNLYILPLQFQPMAKVYPLQPCQCCCDNTTSNVCGLYNLVDICVAHLSWKRGILLVVSFVLNGYGGGWPACFMSWVLCLTILGRCLNCRLKRGA